jgi:hypothetical protein
LINWLGDITADQLFDIFLAEKERFPRRAIGKCFPRIPLSLFSPSSSLSSSSLSMDDYRFGGNNDLIDALSISRHSEDSQDEGETEGERRLGGEEGNDLREKDVIEGSALITRRLWLYLLQYAYSSMKRERDTRSESVGLADKEGERMNLEKLPWSQVSKAEMRAIAQTVTTFIIQTNGE